VGNLGNLPSFLHLVYPLLVSRREGSKRRDCSAVNCESGLWKTVYGYIVYKTAKEDRGHNAK